MDIKALLPELKRLVIDLSEDLLQRSIAQPEVDSGLREAYWQIEKGGRTADAFEVWREDYLDQVAVAWVLGCVFVRFMEDNQLIDECWLAGDSERRKLAEDTHELYFRAHAHESDREYFEHVFHEVGKIPACRDLFAKGKTPLWAVGPSGDAAMKLLAFWRDVIPETGELKRSFEVEDGDTRFLGDLYQDLSERARKKYALLQTPVFVEEFILDRTLTPALDEFGLIHKTNDQGQLTNDSFRMIDPTCGSGHFLLGGFARLFDLWIKREDNEVVAAQKAFDGVWGVDINPFAVAIARFRLIVAALRACGIKRLKDAPAWNIHLAMGDSLLFGSRWDREGKKKGEQQFLGTEEESWAPEIYACEDKEAISEVLGQQYHAVVGNPPYITVKDKSLNQAYRSRYSTCHRQFSLGVPFTERFFDLTLAAHNCHAGYTGMITANSFMKREFGKTLIESFFMTIDLSHVIDTSGAHIPGHGTPTVILIGRNRRPATPLVRFVVKTKDEPAAPEDPSLGHSWQAIVQNVDNCGAVTAYTCTMDVERDRLAQHPWSLSGSSAKDIFECVETACNRCLSDIADVGIASWAGLDEAFAFDHATMCRMHWPDSLLRDYATGDTIRDWHIAIERKIVAPYSSDGAFVEPTELTPCAKSWWQSRSHLEARVLIGGQTVRDTSSPYYSWVRWIADRYKPQYRITFAFLSTHNHFVLDRGGKAFDRPSPVITLKEQGDEKAHFGLLGILNSSTACFWLKQVMSAKGGGGIGRGIQDEPWENRFDISVTQLNRFPVCDSQPSSCVASLDIAAKEYAATRPDHALQKALPTFSQMSTWKKANDAAIQKMLSLQEELDWECYRHYGLFDDDLCYHGDDLPGLELGQRAFEIVMARQMVDGELATAWFVRHGSEPIIEIPAHWPEDYRKLVERRIDLIEKNKEINLIEKPEYKRRWNTESWESQQQRSLSNWLLDRLESDYYWANQDQPEPRLQSIAELSDKASGDHNFRQVAAIYRGRDDFDMASVVTELVESESVPFLPTLRYKASGLRKREVWLKTWELQRKEDAGEDVGKIKVPPKYASSDFIKSDYWRLRGKLDVPKERWISFPHCETDSDPSLVVGWAGWNHLQQATALIAYYDARKREGWDAKRLTPLLAGLDQLLPWIHQWHPEVDPEFGETAGQSFETMLKADAHELGLTLEDIRAWEPPAKKKGGRRKAKG